MKNKKTIIAISLLLALATTLIGNEVITAVNTHNSVNIASLPLVMYDKSTSVQVIEYKKVSHDIFEITRACYDKGYQELCVSDLWAIGKQESWNRINTIAINTNRTADLGYFGINTIHKLSLECLADIYCSANWVIEKLEQHGYNDNRLDSIGKYHSKTPAIKAIYLAKISKYLTIK